MDLARWFRQPYRPNSNLEIIYRLRHEKHGEELEVRVAN
jgi:hypothetical protein